MQGGRLTLTESIPVNMIVGFIIQMAWTQILDISFLPINSMIAITIPGTSSSIQTLMINYIYFDIFYTEFWVD